MSAPPPDLENAAKFVMVTATGAVVAVEAGKTSCVAGYVKAGVAVVKAHPVIFGIFAAMCVSVIVYKIVKKINEPEKPLTHSSRDSSSTTRNHEMYYYDPDTKSVTNSAPTVTKDSNNNVRKRNVNETSSTNNNLSKKSTTTKEVQTDPIDVNQNGNDRKVLRDKNLLPMSYEERVEDYLSRNIPASGAENSDSDTVSEQAYSETSDSSSWSNISSAKSSDNSEKRKYKDYKKKVHRSFKKYVDKMVQENCDSQSDENSDTSSSASSSSSWSNISSEKSTDDFEKAYKKKMHRTLQKFVKNMNKAESSKAPSECSSTSGSVLSEEPENCIACEQNPVNTHAQPCNHRYMCSDCAMRFFNLYKKCKICRAKIERVVVED